MTAGDGGVKMQLVCEEGMCQKSSA